MQHFAEITVSGVLVGFVYGLVALGFVLIYKSSRIINMAQGQLLLLGAFVFWTLVAQLQLPLLLAIPLALAIVVGIGVLLERIFFRPMIQQSVISALMMTIALMVLLQRVVLLIWGATAQKYQPYFELPTAPFRLGGVAIGQEYVWMALISVVMVGIFILFFKYSKWGLAMRATAENQQIALASGISVSWVFALCWAISCVVALVGGILLGTHAMLSLALSQLGLKCLAVVILGGLDSIPGCIIAGLIVGITENLAAGYIDPLVGISGMKETFPFIIMVLILLIRPYGLFGEVRIERI